MAGRDASLVKGLEAILGRRGVLTDRAALLVYSRDASHLTLGLPLAVALPTDVEQVRAVVQACAGAGVPLVCRGTGTGLSAGAVPADGWVVLSTARLNELTALDATESMIFAQPGVLNAAVSERAAPAGLHFAPDPSSQSASTIGGNIAENAGGPHCLRHGVTLQHLRGLQWCDARGVAHHTGTGPAGGRGFHLDSLLCGSEGTLGVITGSWLNLTPSPDHESTLLAFFNTLEAATTAVGSLLWQGLQPVAVEMVDQAMLQAVEEAFAFGFSTSAAAAMICEFAGSAQAVAGDADRARQILEVAGATQVRLAADAVERAELWKCRKKAFGAVGRLTPSYVTMDVVVPLGRLPHLVTAIQEIKARHGVKVSTAFHAGDGNLHPGVHYDDRDPASHQRAQAAADEIIRTALDMGGSCTGEHGVGMEKLHALPWQLDPVSAGLQAGIKHLFDPAGLLNPGKAVPRAEGQYRPRPEPPTTCRPDWDSLTLAAPADLTMDRLQAQALERGLWIPTGLAVAGESQGLGANLGLRTLYDHQPAGPALLAGATLRDVLLETWAVTGDGRPFHGGAPVFKNVAGFDLGRALCGAAGAFATLEAATLALRLAPELAQMRVFNLPPEALALADSWLLSLVQTLTAGQAGTAGFNLVLDGPRGLLGCLVAGSDCPWDLGRLDEALAEGLARACPDVAETHRQSLPFARGGELLAADPLPAWCRSHARWTVWVKTPTAQPGGTVPLDRRWIYQSAARLWWTPDDGPMPAGWLGDPILLDGERPLPPAPSSRATAEILAGLKALFDPGNSLGPAWSPSGKSHHD